MKSFDVVGYLKGDVGYPVAQKWADELRTGETRLQFETLSRADVARLAGGFSGGAARLHDLRSLVVERARELRIRLP